MEAQSTALTQVAPLQAALAIATEAGDLKALNDVAAMGAALQKGARARGLGIEAENQAAEVVIRAERGMGQVLLEMEDAGRLAGQGQGKRSGFLVAEEVITGPSARQFMLQWKTLARLTDEEFEAILESAISKSGRLAKWNAYLAARPRSADPGVVEGENDPQAVNPGFVSIRSGIYKLLGWEVDDEGEGRATKNGLTTLPTDQLTELKTLVEALALAFGVAMKARRAAA